MLDYQIREILCDYLDDNYQKIRIMDEIVIGKARADLVAVTDIVTGYEIKSDADSYTRLPGQIKEYQKYFQKNYLVVGQRYRHSAATKVPDYWGIICVCENELEGHTDVEVIREAKENPKFAMKWQLRLLWRNELVNIAVSNALPKYSGKKKKIICDNLLARIPRKQLEHCVCEEFFERDYTLLSSPFA